MVSDGKPIGGAPLPSNNSFQTEVESGARFRFGENWARFLAVLDEQRIVEAERSLADALGVSNLAGKRFIDVGSGSGLFSLAARRMGAEVRSFDYDPESVACTAELRRRYFRDDSDWQVERGSALDSNYLAQLGTFDIVYSWGVLHHTGAMWDGLANVERLVAPSGILFISIYNDQGGASGRWTLVKKAYNRVPRILRPFILVPAMLRLWTPALIRGVVGGNPTSKWTQYSRTRGMSPWHDLVDWVGGYPFEVARPEEIFDFFRKKGFELNRLRTCAGGIGCNEFVFRRS